MTEQFVEVYYSGETSKQFDSVNIRLAPGMNRVTKSQAEALIKLLPDQVKMKPVRKSSPLSDGKKEV